MTRCPCYSRLGAHWVSSPRGLGLLDIRKQARKLVILLEVFPELSIYFVRGGGGAGQNELYDLSYTIISMIDVINLV